MLNNINYDLRGDALLEAERMRREGIDVIKLNTGNPAAFGFNAPEEVFDALRTNVMRCQPYSESKGIDEAREAVLEYCVSIGIPDISLENIYLGNGVSELISITIQALLNPNDEVLVPAPDYPLWTASVGSVGGKTVHYICDEESNWYPDLNDIRKKVTSRTKAIVVINPNNPTGALYPNDILQGIVDIARENDLIIFADEIYDRLLYDGLKHTPLASLAPDLLTITFNGLSKSHMLCGYRSGWMSLSGDKSNVRDYIEGIDLLTNMRLCSNIPAQVVIRAALDTKNSTKKYFVPGGRLHEQREAMYNAIQDVPGLSVVKPQGSLYMFPKVDIKKYNIVDDEQFILDFLKKHHVLFTNGTGFNWPAPDHFRIVFLPEVPVLESISGKLIDFLKDYSQK
jgi:alanine-synthesizing transaminase